jgi:hypothetical protein
MTVRKPKDPAMILLACFIIGGLGLAAMPWLIGGFQQVSPPSVDRVVSNDRQASRVVRDIRRCLVGHKAKHGGFPASLTQLDTAGPDCGTSRDVRDDQVAGHRLIYVPALRDGEGHIPTFTLCARPLKLGTTGSATIVDDEATFPEAFSVDVTGRDVSCVQGWITSPWHSAHIAAIRHCVLSFAAAHPQQGYPAQASQLGPSGDGCLVVGGRLSLTRDVLRWDHYDDGSYAYLPGPPDAQGRIVRYQIHHLDKQFIWSDETGAAHTPDDSDDRIWLEKSPETHADLRRRRNGIVPNPTWLEHECRAGRADQCVDWGDVLVPSRKEDSVSWDQAVQAYATACERRRADGCLRAGEAILQGHGLETPKAAQEPDVRACAFLERACALGSGEGCWVLLRGMDSGRCSRPAALKSQLLNKACDAKVRRACSALAIGLLTGEGGPGDAVRAAEMLDKECAAGDLTACGPLGHVYLEGLGRPKNLTLARYFLRRSCALTGDSQSCDALDRVPVG